MIRGDASDGLPGIRGIGEKGAAKIAQSFANFTEVLDAAHNGDSRLSEPHRKKILADLNYAHVVERLVSCKRDLRLPDFPQSLSQAPANAAEITRLKEELGLGASVDRLFSALRWI